MKTNKRNKWTKLGKKAKQISFPIMAALAFNTMIPIPVLAAAGVDDTLKSFLTLLFSIVRIVGAILTLFGMLQVGLAVKQHDGAQRAQGFLVLVGGLIVFFAKEILGAIGVSV